MFLSKKQYHSSYTNGYLTELLNHDIQNAFQHINNLKGFINTILPCTALYNMRQLFPGSPKTAHFDLVLFSKTTGKQCPWISYIELEGGAELSFPLIDCKYFSIWYLL